MIIVTGRRGAQRFVPEPDEKWVGISITDPGSGPADLNPDHFVDLLRLQFEDAEPGEPYGGGLSEKMFSHDDAKKICRLFSKHLWDGAMNYLIHCEMGVSRSNAVGRFIASKLWLDPSDKIFFETFDTFNGREAPDGNTHVARMLEQVWDDGSYVE